MITYCLNFLWCGNYAHGNQSECMECLAETEIENDLLEKVNA
jgi:hypothetical protein